MTGLLFSRTVGPVAARLSAYVVVAVSLAAGVLVLAAPRGEAVAVTDGERPVARADVAACLSRLGLDVRTTGHDGVVVVLNGGSLLLRVHRDQRLAFAAVGARTVGLPNGPRGIVPVDNNVSWRQQGAVAVEHHARISHCLHARPRAAWHAAGVLSG